MKTLKINQTTLVPLENILRIMPLSDKDRAQIVENLDIDAAKFQTRIEYANSGSNLAMESIDDIRKQGVGLVNLGANSYVPALSIMNASSFSQEEADALREKGYNLTCTFRFAVKTVAGRILSQATPEQVMERRAKALNGVEETYSPEGV